MGLFPPPGSSMLHLLLASSLLSLAAAEADPQLLYGAGLPYASAPLPYVGAAVGAVPRSVVVKSDVVTPAEVSQEVSAHPVPLGPFGYYGKRSADAEPAVLAGGSRILTPPTPLIHNPPVLPVAYAHPLGYAGYAAHPLAYHGLPVLVAPAAAAGEAVVAERRKREADPQVLLNGAVLPYAAPLATPATLATVGAVAHHPVVKSVVDSPAEVSHEVTAHAVPVAYHGLGYGYPYYG